MRRGRRAAHKRPPWPERVFHEEIEPLIHDPAPARRVWATMLIGVVVVLTLAAGVLGVLRLAGVTTDDTSTSSRPHGTTPTAPATPAMTPATTPDTTPAANGDEQQALASCRQLWSLERGVLTAARPAMGQWEQHIAAMNQLVAGKITLTQAVSYWSRSRVRAERHVRAFEAADRSFRSTSASVCPAATARPPGASTDLAACAEAAGAAGTTLAAARTSMRTWSHHIRDMERLRTGALSPTMAQQMWLQTWKQGARELRVYQHDETRSEQLGCPS